MTIFQPAEILNKIEIKPGSIVADFGCGSGYFTLELAKKVGPEGKVYALDILPTALESVRSLAKIYNLNNIETRWTNLEKTSTLEKESCDLILISNLFFQIEKSYWPAIIKEVEKVLKKEGQVLIIDWSKETPLGPPKDQRIEPQEILKLMENFHLINKWLVSETHWAILLQKYA